MNKKMVLAGFWSHDHCEESFSKEISDYGIDVIPFKISEYFKGRITRYFDALPLPIGPVLRINKDLSNLVLTSQFEYIFLWNCNHIFPSTLRKLKKKGVKIISYNNDDPYGSVIANKKPWLHFIQFFWFLKSLKFSDLIFVYRPVNIKEATKFSTPPAKIELFQPYFIPSNQEYTVSNIEYKQDVIFIGHYEEDNRFSDLAHLFENDIDLRIYGTGWRNKFAQYQDTIHPLYGEDYIKELRRSKICLCFLSKMNRDVYTRRCFEIPGLNLLLLCERTAEMMDLFEEDQEAVYFEDKYELIKKIRWLLGNPSKMKDIAEAGYKRAINDGHDIKSRSIEILQKL